MTRLAIPSEENKLKIVGPYDDFEVSRVQRLDINSDIPTTDIYEIGDNLAAGTAQDTPNVTLTFSLFDVGIKAFATLTGNDPASYPGAGVDISDLGEVDAVIYVKDASVSDFVKSIHAKRLQIRDFTFTYNVDGESTEDYTLIGSERRLFKNDVVVDRFTTGTTSFSLSQTPIALKNGNKVLSVILDGVYLTEVAAGPATGEFSVSGTTVTTFDTRSEQCLIVYHANPAGNNWTYISDATMPAAIRGRDVGLVISANDISRVQSVTINGDLNVQAVREMNNRNIVGYQRQVPTVNGTIGVLDTDTELIDLILYASTNSGETEFDIAQPPASGVSLTIELHDPDDNSAPYTVLKSVYIPTITVVGDAWSSNVNQNTTWNINFKSTDAQCIVYSGSVP